MLSDCISESPTRTFVKNEPFRQNPVELDVLLAVADQEVEDGRHVQAEAIINEIYVGFDLAESIFRVVSPSL
jgi:hypothetical protein